MALKRDKTANGAFREAVSTLYQGALHFQNVLHCHGTPINVISFRPIKVQYFLHLILRHTITFFPGNGVCGAMPTLVHTPLHHTQENFTFFAGNRKRDTKLQISINLVSVRRENFGLLPAIAYVELYLHFPPLSFTILPFAGSAHPKH